MIYLTEGDEIAVSNPQSTIHNPQSIHWSRIKSIEFVGYEQVYDIEVEGVHNFVAGHWIKVDAGLVPASSSGDVAAERSSATQGKAIASPLQFSSVATTRVAATGRTHFFGGIIAHNTYITDTLGIAESAPPSTDKLYVVGNAGITGDLTVGGTMTYSSDVTISGINMVYLADGTATAPSLTFADDTNTGLFSPSNDALSITTAGSERMRVASDGNVGIGTTRPIGKLQVSGTGNVIFNQSGNIGIGTTSPNAKLTVVGDIIPEAAGTRNLGDATYYWNDVSYKTITDRGCLGSFDKGVEMRNGKIVSDIEALKLIRVKPDQLTVYGQPRLDYSTMPKAVYKPAPIAQEDIYEEVNGEKVLKYKKGEKMGEDGAETTALISVMIGAIKELDEKIEELEEKVRRLQEALEEKGRT